MWNGTLPCNYPQNGRAVELVLQYESVCKSRVPNQNGVSLLYYYIMLEIRHSGRGPSKCARDDILCKHAGDRK